MALHSSETASDGIPIFIVVYFLGSSLANLPFGGLQLISALRPTAEKQQRGRAR